MILACRSKEKAEAAAFDIRRVSAWTHSFHQFEHGIFSQLWFLFAGKREPSGGLHAPGSGQSGVCSQVR